MKDTLIETTPTAVRRVTVCSSAGRLSAGIIRPARLSDAPPLVVLHGISRNAGTLARLFAPEAERTGRTLIVPHFPAETWPDFQRPSKKARPDLALLALLDLVAAEYPDIAGPVDIFGHSGGAQLAHRLAMLYPHRVAALHLAAAGWYCLPNESMRYPYGLAAGTDTFTANWARRHAAALRAFLDIPVCVHVGTDDVTRDDALRTTSALDARQGRHRYARARTYVTALNAAAEAADLSPRARLIEMADCDHDVVRAITENHLATRVLDARAALT
ncbi:alpha/beta hydrolase [Roseovarius sp. MBR-6]|jgi:pimeloyl-ACP methyl ester carboxylesterase|uniref:alpha/beta fold hydrolase n=1 Tax=Roseovarius sp. MBR-6 TaxID=3156459 RepID=UPI0033986F6E